MMLIEDLTGDMRRVKIPTQDIVLLIKFMMSDHCQLVPEEFKKGDKKEAE